MQILSYVFFLAFVFILFFCQLLLAYDDFYAKYPDGEINKEQFMEVSKVTMIMPTVTMMENN